MQISSECLTNVDLLLDQRLRRWPNNKPTLVSRASRVLPCIYVDPQNISPIKLAYLSRGGMNFRPLQQIVSILTARMEEYEDGTCRPRRHSCVLASTVTIRPQVRYIVVTLSPPPRLLTVTPLSPRLIYPGVSVSESVLTLLPDYSHTVYLVVVVEFAVCSLFSQLASLHQQWTAMAYPGNLQNLSQLHQYSNNYPGLVSTNYIQHVQINLLSATLRIRWSWKLCLISGNWWF